MPVRLHLRSDVVLHRSGMGLRTIFLGLCVLFIQQVSAAQSPTLDSDGDSLSDTLEQTLLDQFAPKFMIGKHECSTMPAAFEPGLNVPTVAAEDGTIYGQAFPSATHARDIELHFYHLWKTDCGPHGHPLDAEHVAVLVQPVASPEPHWKAVYWFAAAHEATVCDVSQIARASTLHAEDHGATVWISPGKHASYLDHTLCRRGCGADVCEEMKPIARRAVINLGELKSPMNGSAWSSSAAWPLAAKMSASDFPAAPIARLEALPETDIAWFNAGRHPAQGIIAISSSTANAIGNSGDNTATAISLARDSTGNALTKSYRKTTHALGTSARHVGKALHVGPEADSSSAAQPSPKSED